MIAKIASKITNTLKYNKIISENELEVYQYGLEMLISTVINCIIVTLFGLFLHELLAAAIFFIIFALIRSSSGGYHACTYLKCNSLFSLNLGAVLFFLKFAFPFYSLICHITFILIYFIIILKYAPIENSNKPLLDYQKKRNKILCIFYGSILAAVSLFLWYLLDLKKYAMLIVVTMLSVALSMAIVILKSGGDIYEKNYS